MSVVQGFIWYAAFVNAGHGSALNYVSFAGTLISIIFAVLAIGYTYGESVSEKTKGDTLGMQIAALSEVTRGMKVQAESLNEVSKIEAGLSEVARRIEDGFLDTQRRMSGVSDGLEAVRARVDQMNSIREAPIRESGVDRAEAARSILGARTPQMEICVLLLVAFSETAGKGGAYSQLETFIQECVEAAEKRSADIVKGDIRHYGSLFLGGALSISTGLQGFNLVTLNKRHAIEIDSTLIAELQRTTLISPMSAGEFYVALREEVVSRIRA